MAAPKIGVLGQAHPAAATNTDLYTVPAGRRAVISTLTVSETNATATTFRVLVRPTGAAISGGNQAVAYDTPIDASAHVGFTEGWTLAAGDIVTVRSLSGNVTFTAFGEETDVPTA